MGTVTPQLVKELRERTGVGMAKCKQALDETGGNLEDAIDFLRKSGAATAVKKGARETNEGAIGFAENDSHLAFVELNAETDFVTQNERFKEFLTTVAESALAAKATTVEELSAAQAHGGSQSIEELRVDQVQSMGENIVVKRVLLKEKKENASYGLYSHMGGKIVCAAEISGGSEKETLAKDVAMHVAAEAPDYLTSEEIPADVRAREEEIAREQVKGKPENIIEKIVEGKLRAFYEQVCLVDQKFVKDPAQKVSGVVKAAGSDLELTWFLRWQIGQ